MLQTGDIIDGKYRLIRKLGEGGEGSVFLTIHLRTEQFWALKAIEDTGERSGGWGNELEMMKNLNNPHLPKIIDVVRSGSYICLVMEHVRGVSLSSYLDGGKSASARQTMDAAMQMAETLCYLESRDPPVCHLDIKPSNLIMRTDGLIKLVDFGAAWKGTSDVRPMGTEGYAAPEQYRMGSRTGTRPDARTDIYGLGATLYRMISGKKYSESLRKSVIPNCPDDFSRIILKCLANEPDRRYQSASELRQGLISLKRKETARETKKKILGALAIAFPALAFCVSVVPQSLSFANDRQWDYSSILHDAEVAGKEESMALYRKAIFLEPGRKEAWLQYLEDAQSDGIFSPEEETFLRDTLHTVAMGSESTCEEILMDDPEAYGEISLQTGFAYWYGSSDEEWERIGAAWFSRAAQEAGKCDNDDSGWQAQALWYGKLSSSWMLLEEKADSENAPQRASEYWESLRELTDTFLPSDDPLIRIKLCRDALSNIAFLTEDLKQAGISMKEQSEMISGLIEEVRGIQESGTGETLMAGIRDEAEHAFQTAEQAIRNAWARETDDQTQNAEVKE